MNGDSSRKKPCIRCLLRDMEKGEQYRQLKEYLDSFEEDIRSTDVEYNRRLEICRQCESLNEGICGKCGCFVEARALRKYGTCPHEEPRW